MNKKAGFEYEVRMPENFQMTISGKIKVALIEYVEFFLKEASSIEFEFQKIEYKEHGVLLTIGAKITKEMEKTSDQWAKDQAIQISNTWSYKIKKWIGLEKRDPELLEKKLYEEHIKMHQLIYTEKLKELMKKLSAI